MYSLFILKRDFLPRGATFVLLDKKGEQINFDRVDALESIPDPFKWKSRNELEAYAN